MSISKDKLVVINLVFKFIRITLLFPLLNILVA